MAQKPKTEQQAAAPVTAVWHTAHVAHTGSVAHSHQVIMLVRAAERTDRVCAEYLNKAFRTDGGYIPYDSNQPARISVNRAGGTANYVDDPTITELGALTAQMLGRGLLMAKLKPAMVVASPALRCVQTADAIARAVDARAPTPVAVETALFDWAGWYNRPPALLAEHELIERGVRLDAQYTCRGPRVTTGGGNESVVDVHESLGAYYERIKRAIGHVAHYAPPTGLTIVVGHASTLDACGRALIGSDIAAPDRDEMDNMGIYYPYCGHIALARDKSSAPGKWSYVYLLVPPISYTGYSSHVDTQFHNRVAAGSVIAAIDASRHKLEATMKPATD